VLCHAIADALLGAMGLPDIGYYFPPGDPSCKDISSLKILEKCRELAAEERPCPHQRRLHPHRRGSEGPAPPRCHAENIGTALGIAPSRVGIKATTNEGMGFIGRKEGIAALAVAQRSARSNIFCRGRDKKCWRPDLAGFPGERGFGEKALHLPHGGGHAFLT
jgi:2-C-methyl-D-erythritol 2,4-cyclodiphosphate synthase